MWACCRHVWNLLEDQRSREAVEFSERFADGAKKVLRKQLTQTRKRARQADDEGRELPVEKIAAGATDAAIAAWRAADEQILPVTLEVVVRTIQQAKMWEAWVAWREAHPKEFARSREKWWNKIVGDAVEREGQFQSNLIRDIFGNPFRPVTIDPAWLTSTVVSLARPIYAERAFDRLPMLADALEDAGCDNADILNHCRQPGEHVRGCWCVDSLLGKE